MKKKLNLNKDEQALLESIERGEWKPVKNQAKEIRKHREFALTSLKKRLLNIHQDFFKGFGALLI